MTLAVRGALNHYAGAAAEHGVERRYADAGYALAAERYLGGRKGEGRGIAGEIDLIFRKGPAVVFVEVKRSRSHDQAAAALSSRQIQRLHKSAIQFLANEPHGQDTDCRFDVALVDGQGHIKIIDNALCA